MNEWKEQLEEVIGSVAKVDKKIDYVNVALSKQIENLDQKVGDRMCQIGQAGCSSASSCGITDDNYDTGSGWTTITKSLSVTFPKAFPKTPLVKVAMNAAKLKAGGKDDGYGWNFSASYVTTTGFTMNMQMIDRYFYSIHGVYIACTNWKFLSPFSIPEEMTQLVAMKHMKCIFNCNGLSFVILTYWSDFYLL